MHLQSVGRWARDGLVPGGLKVQMLTGAICLCASDALHTALGRLTGTSSQGSWAQESERGSWKPPHNSSLRVTLLHSVLQNIREAARIHGLGKWTLPLDGRRGSHITNAKIGGIIVAIFANNLPLNLSCGTTKWRAARAGDHGSLGGNHPDYKQAKSPLRVNLKPTTDSINWFWPHVLN